MFDFVACGRVSVHDYLTYHSDGNDENDNNLATHCHWVKVSVSNSGNGHLGKIDKSTSAPALHVQARH